MRGRRGEFNDSNKSITNEQLQQKAALMELEARRDFLRQYADKDFTYHIADQAMVDKKEKYQAEIQALETSLNSKETHREKYALILLKKIGQDNQGISTTLAKHFGQLAGADGDAPFVLLKKEGAQLIWPSKEAANQFFTGLQQHHLRCAQAVQGLADGDVPEPMKGTDAVKKFQSGNCVTVTLPHTEVEKLVALAQFHPYNLKQVVSDWYEAKKLDRAALLGQEINNESNTKIADTRSPLQVATFNRVSFSDTEDLIQLSVAAEELKVPDATVSHHVIILLDDSGSMCGSKMHAANAALGGFLLKLPENTIVSIQPFNATTLCYRTSITEIKKNIGNYTNTPATDDTPLIESLATSALFVRENPNDLLISEAALQHTTIALLTDGQPNKGNSQDAISAMQKSEYETEYGNLCLFAVDSQKVGNFDTGQFISYGVSGFACQQLPVVFPIAIGAYSDQKFLEELAASMNMPHAFVDTDLQKLQKDIDDSMNLLLQMLGKLSRAFIGINYDLSNHSTAQGVEEQNLFYGRTRDIFFRVPKDAKDLSFFAMIENQGEKYRTQCVEVRDAQKKDAIIGEYVEKLFFSVKLAFFNKVNALKSNAPTTQQRERGMTREDFERTQQKNQENQKQWMQEKQNKLIALQTKTLTELSELRQVTKDQSVLAEINCFEKTVQQLTMEQVVKDTTDWQKQLPSRGQIATHTQQRILGRKFDKKVAQTYQEDTELATLNQLIAQKQYQKALQLITQNRNLLNEKSTDQFSATPLMTALATFGNLSDPDKNERRQFIWQAVEIAKDVIDFTVQDASGNTFFHRAAWYGEFDIFTLAMKHAIDKNQLSQLKKCKNKTQTGMTQGETILDNVRASSKLKTDDKNKIQLLMNEPLSKEIENVSDADINDYPALLNQHEANFGNTILIQWLRDLNQEVVLNKKDVLRNKILDCINQHANVIDFSESNHKGNTLLHLAIWYKEFDIAQLIIDKAISQGDDELKRVLQARNTFGLSHVKGNNTTLDSGGEVPHMNLAAQGHACFAEFTSTAEKVLPWLQQYIFTVPDFTENCNNLSDLLKQLESYLQNELLFCPAAQSQIQAKITDVNLVLQSIRQLEKWQQLAKKLQHCLTEAQQTECTHLSQVYGKYVKGYNPTNFLQQAPIQQLGKLIGRASGMGKTELVGKLEKLRQNLTQDQITLLHQWVSDEMEKNSTPKQSIWYVLFNEVSQKKEAQALLQLLQDTKECMVRLQAYANGDSATLDHFIAGATSQTFSSGEESVAAKPTTFYF